MFNTNVQGPVWDIPHFWSSGTNKLYWEKTHKLQENVKMWSPHQYITGIYCFLVHPQYGAAVLHNLGYRFPTKLIFLPHDMSRRLRPTLCPGLRHQYWSKELSSALPFRSSFNVGWTRHGSCQHYGKKEQYRRSTKVNNLIIKSLAFHVPYIAVTSVKTSAHELSKQRWFIIFSRNVQFGPFP